MAQAEASVVVALPGAAIFYSAPSPVAAASVSGHSRALTAEQIERARSSRYLEMLRSALQGSRERSQSQAASSVAETSEGKGIFGEEGRMTPGTSLEQGKRLLLLPQDLSGCRE